jgi:hypothetical protein
MHVTEPRLCLETHIIVPRYSTLTSCLHVSCLSAIVLGLDPDSDARKLRATQVETEARLFVQITNTAPSHRRWYPLLMKIAVSVPRPKYFLSTRTHPTRIRRKGASTCGRLGWSFSRLLWALISTNNAIQFCQYFLLAVRRSLTVCFQVTFILYLSFVVSPGRRRLY